MSEKNLVPFPQPASEPPIKTVVNRIRVVHVIRYDNPLHFEPVLGAYAKVDEKPGPEASQMVTGYILNTAKQLGGAAETVDVEDRALPEELIEALRRNQGRPFRIANGVLLERPGELIYAGPKSSSPAVAVEEIFSSTQTPTLNPPYPPKWEVIEGGVVDQPQPTENPLVPNNLRYIRPLTDKELEEAA